MLLPYHLLNAPEGAVAAPPAPTTPAPAPTEQAPPVSSATAGTPVPESTSGSASLIDEMDRMLAQPQKPEAKPEEKGRQRGEDGKFKPEEKKPDEKPAEPAKPKEAAKPVDPVKEKDPVQLRKRLAELEGQLKQKDTEKQTELTKLNQKIAEFEKRKYVTPEQEAQNRRNEERAKKLEADLAARDYKSSDEFKREYVEPWQNEWKNAVQNVTQLQIDNEDGTTRQATQQDFENVRLAGNFIQQRTLAKTLFKDNWDVVMQHISAMRSLEEKSAKAVEAKAKNFELEQQQQTASYQTKYDETDAALVAKYPQHFGDDPNAPEAAAEMKKGLEFIDRALEQAQRATPQEQAVAAATIRRWAASFPRMVYTLNQKDSEIAGLKEKLAKYEASDPGAGGEGAAPVPSGDDGIKGGVDAMAAEFEKMGV